MQRNIVARSVLGVGLLAGGIAVSGVAVVGQPQVASAQAPVYCDGAGGPPNPVFITGSSAVKPFLDAVGKALAAAPTPITIVYPSALPGSCAGVKAKAGAGLNDKSAAWSYYDAAGALKTCAPNDLNLGIPVSIGASDVFPTSCVGVAPDQVTGVTDAQGPVQVMTFVVPAASNQDAISAEAAYLAYGKGTAGMTNWDDNTVLYRRDENSGTQTMLSFAIFPTYADPALRFNAFAVKPATSGSSGMVTAIAAGGVNANKMIGILSTGETDESTNRSTIKRLAYKHYGQTCAFWPDTNFTSFDKLPVRNGQYAVWGPLHLLSKNPSADAQKVIDIITGATTLDGVDLLAIATAKHIVPQCAMNVRREAEMGPILPVDPQTKKSCGCYFDKNVPGGTLPAACTVCDADMGSAGAMPCTDAARPHCNYGYCEVH